MTKYAVVISKSGKILSLKSAGSDTLRYAQKDLKGSHISRLIGFYGQRDLRYALQATSATRKPVDLQAFMLDGHASDGPEIQWTVRIKSIPILGMLLPVRYLLVGTSRKLKTSV